MVKFCFQVLIVCSFDSSYLPVCFSFKPDINKNHEGQIGELFTIHQYLVYLRRFSGYYHVKIQTDLVKFSDDKPTYKQCFVNRIHSENVRKCQQT